MRFKIVHFLFDKKYLFYDKNFQSQLVVDWLEQNASDLADGYGLEQYTDKTIAWENTLHELQSKKPIPYKSSRELITQLDPDAPHREKKALHDLDKVTHI